MARGRPSKKAVAESPAGDVGSDFEDVPLKSKITSDDEKPKAKPKKVESDEEKPKAKPKKIDSEEEKPKAKPKKVESDDEKPKAKPKKVESDDDKPKKEEKSKRKPSQYNVMLGEFMKKIALEEKDKAEDNRIPRGERMKKAQEMYREWKATQA